MLIIPITPNPRHVKLASVSFVFVCCWGFFVCLFVLFCFWGCFFFCLFVCCCFFFRGGGGVFLFFLESL